MLVLDSTEFKGDLNLHLWYPFFIF